MNGRVRRILAGLVAVATTLGLTVVAASPASAAATASISRSIKLAGSSTGVAELPYGDPRFIYLAAGKYTWTLTLSEPPPSSPFPESREIKLDEGWYDWQCELVGTGVYYTFGDNYYIYCYLYRPDRATAYLPYDYPWYIHTGPGNYNWVNTLDPHF